MNMKVVLMISVITLFTTTKCEEDDGQYHPDPSNDGHYIPDNSGLYTPDYTGTYRHDGSGVYADNGGGQFNEALGKYRQLDQTFNAKDNARSGRYESAPIIANPQGPSANLLSKETQTKQTLTASGSSFAKNLIGETTFGQGKTSSANYIGNTASATANVGNFAGNRGQYADGRWKILRQLSDYDNDGYHWEYETENGITAEESGRLANKGTEAEAMRAQGFYEYTGPDNVKYYIKYTADENGFVAVGNHIPTPPPIPEGILKSLEYHRSLGKA